ncbi:MAG: hypothetical protein P8008_05095, partial [Gammaproteobacteria bacterium]
LDRCYGLRFRRFPAGCTGGFMNLLREFFQAVLVAGLPLAALACALVWWALRRGQLAGETFDDLRKSLESLAAERKERK